MYGEENIRKLEKLQEWDWDFNKISNIFKVNVQVFMSIEKKNFEECYFISNISESDSFSGTSSEISGNSCLFAF